jgi:hypothetical protein
MADMFIAPKLKIKRAKQHITEFDDAINAFVKTDFYRLAIDKETDGSHILRFQMTAEVPCEIPLIIGDAVHNLHSALDLAACEMVTMTGKRPSNQLYFPFGETRRDLETTLNKEIKAAGTDIVNLILDVIKPYKGGNDPLYALHRLDIDDKHRILIPTISIASLVNVNVRAGPITMNDCTLSVGPGGILNLLQMPGPFEMQGSGKPIFSVLFDKGQIFEGQPIVPTLHQLSEIVSGVIEAIEKTYLARP